MHATRTGLYRSRDGWILGVCGGIADYFDLSPFWLRMLALLGLALTGGMPLIPIYIVAALVMKPEPRM